MPELSILSDDFFASVVKACSDARAKALKAGHAVVYRDRSDRYIQELPDGRKFEVRLDPAKDRDSHVVVVGEIASNGG